MERITDCIGPHVGHPVLYPILTVHPDRPTKRGPETTSYTHIVTFPVFLFLVLGHNKENHQKQRIFLPAEPSKHMEKREQKQCKMGRNVQKRLRKSKEIPPPKKKELGGKRTCVK